MTFKMHPNTLFYMFLHIVLIIRTKDFGYLYLLRQCHASRRSIFSMSVSNHKPPSTHTTLFQRLYSVHNVGTTLCAHWAVRVLDINKRIIVWVTYTLSTYVFSWLAKFEGRDNLEEWSNDDLMVMVWNCSVNKLKKKRIYMK